MLMASIGVSFLPAGDKLFKAAATKEIEPGINREPLLPVIDDARESKKIWFSERKWPEKGMCSECKRLPNPTSVIDNIAACEPTMST